MIPQQRTTPAQSDASLDAAIVYVIDDDAAIRQSLDRLMRSVGLLVKTFASGQEFLACEKSDAPACLILDVRLRGENGLDFHETLPLHGLHIPVVFVTGHGDVPMTVKAMKAGAFDFLAKPFRDQDVLDAVTHAISNDRKRRAADCSMSPVREAYDSLTPREREAVGYILAGLLNKQIASEMNVSEVTVKMHRGQAMKKMEARSVADLVLKVRSLGVEPARRR